jgi:RsiW-degrading membrane proteinase PrsW (M82 family)
MDFIYYIIAFWILVMPLAFWMYIFVSFFENTLSRFQFIVGILLWAVMSLPLLLSEWNSIWLLLEHLFKPISTNLTLIWIVQMSLIIILFYLILWAMEFASSLYFQEFRKYFISRQVRVWVWSVLLIGIWIAAIVVFKSLFPDFSDTYSVSLWNYIFSWFGSIVWYYIVVSILEEGSKYIGALSYAWKKNFETYTSYIILCACIALGFSFFENIIYSYVYLIKNGISATFLEFIFFRSIFSIALHLLSSMIFASAFWCILHPLPHFKRRHILWFIWLWLWAILSHTLFDVALTYNKVGLIILYVFALYIFMSSLTLQDQW